jgi:hypothetical protein
VKALLSPYIGLATGRPQKITHDYRCSHCIANSAGGWPDDVGLSDVATTAASEQRAIKQSARTCAGVLGLY